LRTIADNQDHGALMVNAGSSVGERRPVAAQRQRAVILSFDVTAHPRSGSTRELRRRSVPVQQAVAAGEARRAASPV
jgi:hypothetical protein